MTEYITVNGKKFPKPSKKRVKTKIVEKTKVVKVIEKPVIEMVKPSEADTETGKVMTAAQIEAVEKKLEELQGPEKKYLAVYAKNLALSHTEEMIGRLVDLARNGDRSAMRAIVEMGIGKPTERKQTDIQPIEVILPDYGNAEGKANSVRRDLSATPDTGEIPRQ